MFYYGPACAKVYAGKIQWRDNQFLDFQGFSSWLQITANLKLALVGVRTPGELANTANPGFLHASTPISESGFTKTAPMDQISLILRISAWSISHHNS